MQSLRQCHGQPFGRTLETRTVTRTALREDTRNSPSGKRTKLRPLYGVAHIRCHLSGRASPSRTSSHRNPDSLSALRNHFVGGREERQIMHAMCERVGVGMESSSPLPYIVVEGVRGAEIQPTKHAPTKQGKHVPTKHRENMFPCPWCSPMGPHLSSQHSPPFV